MNARDELVQIIWDDAVADRVKDGKDLRNVPVVRPKVEGMADKILAAGFVKPRTITTAEELDALPIKSLVLTLDGEVWQRIKGGWGLGPDDYPELSETALWQSSEGPSATVLWEPKP